MEGVFIKEWNSAQDVETMIGFGRKNISSNLRGKSLSAFGFIWKFKDKENVELKIRKSNAGIKRSVIDITTGTIYSTISDAAKEFKINKNRLSLRLSGKIENETPLKYYINNLNYEAVV
ncbi:MAG: hypothetical protein H7Y10_03520 [Flavobacterium sp.]|nr:hypothetical protein [Flavobacterium sp.]